MISDTIVHYRKIKIYDIITNTKGGFKYEYERKT